MNILITGGTGYIGSSICIELLKKFPNANITIIDDMIRGNNEDQLKKFNKLVFIRKNLEELVSGELHAFDFDVVIHCAANAYVGESETNPEKYLNRNVLATSKLLNALNLKVLKKFIFSSTCAVYGNTAGAITEEAPLIPASPYGWSKLISENIIQSYASKYAFNAIILRYFNVAGAVVDNETGERHDPETHLIPLIYVNWLNKKTLEIFGGDYNTEDGTCAREYVHLSDITNAHLLAINNSKLNGTSIMNLCTGNPVTNLQVIKSAERVWQCDINYKIVSRRKGDAESLFGVNLKAKKLIGWEPSNSKIDLILSDYKRWRTKNY